MISLICYGLVLLGTITIALALYTFAILKYRRWLSHHLPGSAMPSQEQRFGTLILHPYLASTIKYKKGIEIGAEEEENSKMECVVCLMEFEEGESVRQLPHCRHCFHGACIDMWLYTHSECPVCRAPIERVDSDCGALTSEEEKSQEVMLHVCISMISS